MRKKITDFFKPLYYKVPILRPCMAFVHRKFFIATKFSGWGLKTVHELPWNNKEYEKKFLKASIDIKKKFEFSKNAAQVDRNNIDELLWRNWIVTYSVRHAIEFANTDYFNFVECGVGDGVSAFFALREINGNQKIIGNFAMHLYDSWMAMRKEGLLESELSHVGRYAELSIEKTKRNLSEFNDNVVYHQGYIPESFNNTPKSLNQIVYLHIDLNSANPTLATLEFFFPRLVRGGVILFDDYAWAGYEDTKYTVDAYFDGKPGIMMKLPTGQAIYFR